MEEKGKKAVVTEMFNNIAHSYDFLNHFLSLGIDRIWRKKALQNLKTIPQPYILDVASGTGDLALAALRYKPKKIIGIDISVEMLKKGEEKIRKKGWDKIIQLQPGDSENLAFEKETFDAVTVAFGVRNFENLHKGLSEMNRVLKIGGKVIILEFSKPHNVFISRFFNFYFFHILPVFGKLISKHHEAYTYLPKSVDTFPYGNAFLTVMQQCGFKKCNAKTVSGGIATIYTGIK